MRYTLLAAAALLAMSGAAMAQTQTQTGMMSGGTQTNPNMPNGAASSRYNGSLTTEMPRPDVSPSGSLATAPNTPGATPTESPIGQGATHGEFGGSGSGG